MFLFKVYIRHLNVPFRSVYLNGSRRVGFFLEVHHILHHVFHVHVCLRLMKTTK